MLASNFSNKYNNLTDILKGQSESKVLITCNHHAVEELRQTQVAVIDAKHKNKDKLTFGDNKWARSIALRNAIFSILNPWALNYIDKPLLLFDANTLLRAGIDF